MPCFVVYYGRPLRYEIVDCFKVSLLDLNDMLGGSCLISVDVDICMSKYIDMKCVSVWFYGNYMR